MSRSILATRLTLPRVFPWLLIVGSLIALYSSFVLSADKLESLKNPNFVPNCNINPVLSCGTVMQTPQASLLGFPNSWIGLAMFASVLTVGVALLAGAQLRREFWYLFKAGMVGGLLFAYWMLAESIYSINALCPFCLTVDVVTITINWYLTLYLLHSGHLRLPKRFKALGEFGQKHHLELLIVWLLVLVAIILQHFWYYYGQFI